MFGALIIIPDAFIQESQMPLTHEQLKSYLLLNRYYTAVATKQQESVTLHWITSGGSRISECLHNSCTMFCSTSVRPLIAAQFLGGEARLTRTAHGISENKQQGILISQSQATCVQGNLQG